MLDRLSADYSRQVKNLSGRLASVLEPILILVLAVFVGFILFATLLPILEAGNVL
jgi:type II secretory pathway component PulF